MRVDEADTRFDSASRATIVAAVIAAAVSVAIVIASSLFQVPYYLGAVLIIICAMMPFFVSFEASRPRARDIVLLAVMCALAIASRAAFAWLPNIKPTAAIVMISGMALGARAGFLTGAITMLASNFLFGQGYWTPWQMIAFGLAGLVFGILVDRGVISRKGMTRKGIIILSLSGALFMLLIAGPILDTSTLFMFLSRITPEGAIAVYLAGVPMNAMQAAATAITLFFLANPILKKVSRIRVKYGMSS